MDSKEYEKRLKDLETQIDRLRSLYDQYFRGIEKMPPTVLFKKVEKEIRELRKVHVRTTAIRFKLQMQVQKFTSYFSYWQRILRLLEDGQLKRGPGVLIPGTPVAREPRAHPAAGGEAPEAEDEGFDIPIDFSEGEEEEEDDRATVPPPPAASLHAIVEQVPPPPAPLPADLAQPAPRSPARVAPPAQVKAPKTPLPMPPAYPSPGQRPSKTPSRRPPPVAKPGEVRRVPVVPIEEKVRGGIPSDAPKPALVPMSAAVQGLSTGDLARKGRMIGAKSASPAPGAGSIGSGEEGGSSPVPSGSGGGRSR